MQCTTSNCFVWVCACAFYLCICEFLFLSLFIHSFDANVCVCVTMNRLRKLRGRKKNIIEVAIAAVTATRHKLFYIQYQHFIQFFIKMDRVDRKIQSYLYQITFLSFPLPACIRLLLMPMPLSSRRLFSFSFTTFMYTVYTQHTHRLEYDLVRHGKILACESFCGYFLSFAMRLFYTSTIPCQDTEFV